MHAIETASRDEIAALQIERLSSTLQHVYQNVPHYRANFDAAGLIESKDGPVIWEDHFYPEIIDPLTGEVLPEGSQGELVFTSLTKEAMPSSATAPVT